MKYILGQSRKMLVRTKLPFDVPIHKHLRNLPCGMKPWLHLHYDAFTSFLYFMHKLSGIITTVVNCWMCYINICNDYVSHNSQIFIFISSASRKAAELYNAESSVVVCRRPSSVVINFSLKRWIYQKLVNNVFFFFGVQLPWNGPMYYERYWFGLIVLKVF